jgi:hypothetical protein
MLKERAIANQLPLSFAESIFDAVYEMMQEVSPTEYPKIL